MNLFAHQEKIVKDNPKRTLLALGTGTGKTRTALALAKQNGFSALVICPKTQKQDRNWERECMKMGIPHDFILVMSREEFRRDWMTITIKPPVLIIDECHTFMGVTPSKKRSKGKYVPKTTKIFEAVRAYCDDPRVESIYLCSATPDRNPMCIWAAADILGYNWNYDEFRETFYWKMSMGFSDIWRERRTDDAKKALGQKIREIGYTARLADCFDVPEQTFRTEYFELTKAQTDGIAVLNTQESNPLSIFGFKHQIENGWLKSDGYRPDQSFACGKNERILELAQEFPKLIIYAKYTLQVHGIADMLKKEGYKVLTLTGETKERGKLFEEAEAATACVMVINSEISAGYELPSFPTMVFASLSWSWVHWEQAIGRILRANALKKNLYIYLVAKGKNVIDIRAFDTVMTKVDFSEAKYATVE